MSQEDPTDGALSGADGNVPASDSNTAASPDTLTLEEINSFLGKDFKTKEGALKAMKDTQSFVGKRKEDIVAEVRKELEPSQQSATTQVEAELSSIKEELFYTQNPQFKDLRAVIAKMGTNPAEVVESAEFKGIFDKVKVADEVEQNRSVIHSTPRLAQDKSVIDEAVHVANSRNSDSSAVAEVLARGILNNSDS